MMSMRTRKLSEVLAFLIALGAAYALWFVPMSLLKQLLVLAFGLAFSGWAAVGRPKTQSSFLTRALMFHKLSFRRLSLILFLIIAFGLDIALGFIDPNYQEWIIVNDNFPRIFGDRNAAEVCVLSHVSVCPRAADPVGTGPSGGIKRGTATQERRQRT